MQKASVAVVLVSNGPGELTTWVRPLAEKLHKKLFLKPRELNATGILKLVLVPCPNAMGNEKEVANKWNLFERITSAKQFWKLLINPRKYGNWPKKGLVIFLGGDQFWSVLLSARLGYKHLTYAEWIARWPQWNDRIAAMSEKVKNRIPHKYRNRCQVVGDLMADLNQTTTEADKLPNGRWIALLPGSKKAKLCVGVPFLLEVADLLAREFSDCKFLLPVAPTTNIDEIESFMTSQNHIAKTYRSGIKRIEGRKINDIWGKIITKSETEIYFEERSPAHVSLSQCEIAITTIGANTAELGSLGVPMIVIVPTQHLNVMQAWDGFIGVIARLPFLRRFIGLIISIWRLRKGGFLSWPNISAGRMIVQEKVGKISPEEIAYETIKLLSSPKILEKQKEDLKSLRGQSGAIELVANEIIQLLPKNLIETKNSET